VGRACGVLQYASVLMYPDDRNPIFSPWTCEHGGGAPVLWGSEGILDQPWLPENVSFLRSTFTLDYVRNSIATAAVTLQGEIDSSVPELMVLDFETKAPFVEQRMEELFFNLSLPFGEDRGWATK